MRAAGHQAHGAERPARQDAGVHRGVQFVDDLLDGDDAALRRQGRFLLHAEDAPEQNVALAVGLLRVDHADVRAHRGHRRQHFAGERAGDAADQRVDLRQVGAGVGAQHCEGQPGGAGDIGVGEVGVAVFLDLQRLRPALLHRVAQAVQRTDAGVAAPGEHQLLRAACTDQQVVDQVGSHADQRQVFPALADQLVAGGRRDQVSEAFEGDAVAIVDEASHRFAQGEDFSHRSGLVLLCAAWTARDENLTPGSEGSQSDNRLTVR